MKKKLIKIFLSKRPGPQNVVAALLGLLVIVALFFADASNFYPVSDFLSASGTKVFLHHEYWRLFTTTLVHADLSHLSMNSIAFTILALLLHTYFGALVFPVLSFMVGGLINVIALSFYPGHVTLVGISGVIYFMAAFWMTLYMTIERSPSVGGSSIPLPWR
ncbi:MAG TPA: rhomboid family intramembrane serine protease [Bacteriovoracaceae bacterium]|nr:rhomboid family intramembrane serine protease [Bacteriovoracaceae bacterium]